MIIDKFKIPKDGKLYQYDIGVEEQPDRWILKFPYNPDVVEYVKANFDRPRFESQTKTWTILKTERNEYVYLLSLGWRDDLYNIPIGNFLVDGHRQLFQHQKDGLNFWLTRKRVMLAFEMGTGKTLTALTGIEWLKKHQQKYIWWLVAPDGAQREWARQIDNWGFNIKFEVISTFESIHKYLHYPVPDGVIFDETVKIKNPKAKRSKECMELCARLRSEDAYILFLSGAPAPRSPEDWWHQIECLRPGWLREGNIIHFRRRYAEVEKQDYGYGEFEKVLKWKEDELKLLSKRISPLVMVKKKSDCFDLPEKIYEAIQCTPTPELLRVANVALATATSALNGLETLRELSDGFRYTNDGTQVIDCPKLGVVEELLNFYSIENGGPGRLVIFAAFTASIDRLVNYAIVREWTPLTIDGRGWSDKQTLNLFESNEEKNYVIIANPACVHGLTLSKTHCLVYYSNNFNVDSRIQSEDRRDRPGMDVSRGTRIVDILHLPSDEYVLNKLRAGISIQNITLEEIRRLYE